MYVCMYVCIYVYVFIYLFIYKAIMSVAAQMPCFVEAVFLME